MMLRCSAALLVLALCLTLPPSEASAGDISIMAGVGPRFDVERKAVDAVSVLHVSYEVIPMFLVSGEFHGYTGGVGVPDDFALADVQLGLLFSAPIPGWFGLEIGGSIGVHNLLQDRHADDSVVGMIKPEVALTASVAIFKARLSYQHNLLPLGTSEGAAPDDGQFTVMAGVVF